jgi:hypothetical protein
MRTARLVKRDPEQGVMHAIRMARRARNTVRETAVIGRNRNGRFVAYNVDNQTFTHGDCLALSNLRLLKQRARVVGP